MSQKKPLQLLCFTDPLCSTCWAFEPHFRKLKIEYGHLITVEYKMGGLLESWEKYNPPNGKVKRPEDLVEYWNDEEKKNLHAVWRDITERKKAEKAIIRLNETLEKRAAELQDSNEELESFAYVASHDLQEPLRMVSSFLQLLEKKLGTDLDETTKQYIYFAVDGAERMKKLIHDLLEYSRVSSSKENSTNVDCNEVISTVRNFYNLRLLEENASLHIKPLPVIKAVQPQIQQLFQNLIDNALKYRSNKPAEIEVGCTENNGYWQFYVKDNGIGIDPKFFDKIFIIFQRLHSKTEYSGTGIGLAVCKKIVETHGGKIWVEPAYANSRRPKPMAADEASAGKSEPGKGSTFYFTIPKNNV